MTITNVLNLEVYMNDLEQGLVSWRAQLVHGAVRTTIMLEEGSSLPRRNLYHKLLEIKLCSHNTSCL